MNFSLSGIILLIHQRRMNIVMEKMRVFPGMTFSLKGPFDGGPIETLSNSPTFRARLEGFHQGCHTNLPPLQKGLCLPIDLVNYVMYLEDL